MRRQPEGEAAGGAAAEARLRAHQPQRGADAGGGDAARLCPPHAGAERRGGAPAGGAAGARAAAARRRRPFRAAQPLAPILARFARSFPELRLEIEVGRSHELRAEQERGALDLVLGKRRDGETEGRPIWTETIVWVAPPGWEAPAGRPLPVAMLPQGCMFRDRALAALARAGMGFEVVYTSASLLGVAAAAQAGLAATVLGRSGLPAGLVEHPGLPPLGVAEMAVFGDATGQTQLVEPLIELIRDSIAGG
ncbi:LysR substrate-binding domain-containing protein [Pseudoroseomonas cervicalis]|uniref:LysR substrate-binding domain-containing protein n=1 Tax=Teichococcus cervicalis TaxID=204525 RepID=UPI0035EE6D71